MQTHQLVAKVKDHKVYVYQSNGLCISSIVSGAASAVLQGDEVHVTMLNGQIRVYTINGLFKQSI